MDGWGAVHAACCGVGACHVGVSLLGPGRKQRARLAMATIPLDGYFPNSAFPRSSGRCAATSARGIWAMCLRMGRRPPTRATGECAVMAPCVAGLSHYLVINVH